MLTKSEQKWLRGRELSPRPYCASCINAKICAKTRKQCWCPTDGIDRYDAHILQDALEFSERVAVKLAITGDIWDFEDMPCRGDERQYIRINCKLRKNHWDCADCYIKAARLQVEEEMGNEP